MGTAIELKVGDLSLDYSKNSRGIDHGALFQEADRQRMRSAQIDYDYFAKSGKDPGPREWVFARPLKRITPRLELLGHTLTCVEREYDLYVAQAQENAHAHAPAPAPAPAPALGFSDFLSFVTEHPIASLNDAYVAGSDEAARREIQGRFADDTRVAAVPHPYAHVVDGYSERSFFASLISFLHPYSALRLLAENQANAEALVVWDYGLLVDAGWASEQEFVSCCRREQTFLIATEGSSDAHVIQHALKCLMPEVEDFFRFIDVSERHPFSGTGSLLTFAEGLAKIDVHNQVVFVFDNDAEGVDTFRKMQRFALPPNMRGMVLPDRDEFRTFRARGPEGVVSSDINGRAAAIECYLDLDLQRYPQPQVHWTTYKKDIDAYQGALEHKGSYVKAFLAATPQAMEKGIYDARKMRGLLAALVHECCAMSSTRQIALRSTW